MLLSKHWCNKDSGIKATISISAIMTGSNSEKTTTVFSSEIEFTDEEMMWLINLSPEVTVGKLSPLEEGWSELAKPKTRAEAEMFQLRAIVRFGLTDLITTSITSNH